jgi:hypothetical protein
MTEAEWLTGGSADWMVECSLIATKERKQRLFAVACCRRHARLLTEKAAKAVDAAESYADDLIKFQQMILCHEAVEVDGLEGHYHDLAKAAKAASFGGANDADAWRTAGWVAEAFGTVTNYVLVPSETELAAQVALVRDIFGNPFRPVAFSPAWRTDTAVAIARQMYDSRDFGAMPILADALQDARCEDEHILSHCRDANATHVRGCWVVDLVLGKE